MKSATKNSTSSYEKKQPLDGQALFNDGWVFFAYGLILGILFRVSGSSDDQLNFYLGLLLEPFSYRAFIIITLIGWALVMGAVLISNKRKISINDNKFLQHFCIPISEVGLSAGAIIIGTSLGLGLSHISIAVWPEQSQIARSALGLSFMVFGIQFLLFWQQRNAIEELGVDNLLINIIGFLYAVLFFVLLFFADRQAMRYALYFTGWVTFLAAIFILYKKCKSRV